MSEADQALADRRLPADADASTLEAYEDSKMAREATTIHRVATREARARTTTRRAATAVDRDVTAARRDETARIRDERARALERSIATSDASPAEKMERFRARAEADRLRAAADRARAAQDRADAARERARLEAALNSGHLDDLTGAFRREAGWLALNNEIDRARRSDGRFVIAFVDVDGMKSLNDRDGHAAGDHVLRGVGGGNALSPALVRSHRSLRR